MLKKLGLAVAAAMLGLVLLSPGTASADPPWWHHRHYWGWRYEHPYGGYYGRPWYWHRHPRYYSYNPYVYNPPVYYGPSYTYVPPPVYARGPHFEFVF